MRQDLKEGVLHHSCVLVSIEGLLLDRSKQVYILSDVVTPCSEVSAMSTPFNAKAKVKKRHH